MRALVHSPFEVGSLGFCFRDCLFVCDFFIESLGGHGRKLLCQQAQAQSTHMGWSRGCNLLLSSTTTFPHAPRPSIPSPGLQEAPCAHIYFKSTFYNLTEAPGVQPHSPSSPSPQSLVLPLATSFAVQGGVIWGSHDLPSNP